MTTEPGRGDAFGIDIPRTRLGVSHIDARENSQGRVGVPCSGSTAWFWFACLITIASPATGLPQGPSSDDVLLPQLTELFWALFLLGAFVLIGVAWVGIIRRDIRKHTETVRQREAALEEHYRELFENAHDIIFTHDLEGNLISLNNAGERILGYSRAEATMHNFADLVSADSLQPVREILDRFRAGQPDAHCELEMRARDGRRVALRVNLRLQQHAGKAPRVQGIAWDISGQKEAEEALRKSEQRLRQSLEERVQLGRDLHDGLIQSIYAIGLGLGECRRLIQESPVEAEARLGKAINDLNSVIRDVRDFIVGLEPEALKGQELKGALQSLVTTMSETHAAQFSFDIDSRAADRLTSRQATQLLQIAREAMSNSLRHARATSTSVALSMRNGCVQLEVQDDGAGFDMAARRDSGHGLRNIAARARELGASSEVVSAPGNGTRVLVTLPFEQTR